MSSSRKESEYWCPESPKRKMKGASLTTTCSFHLVIQANLIKLLCEKKSSTNNNALLWPARALPSLPPRCAFGDSWLTGYGGGAIRCVGFLPKGNFFVWLFIKPTRTIRSHVPEFQRFTLSRECLSEFGSLWTTYTHRQSPYVHVIWESRGAQRAVAGYKTIQSLRTSPT